MNTEIKLINSSFNENPENEINALIKKMSNSYREFISINAISCFDDKIQYILKFHIVDFDEI